jgi:hypothetical protein
MPTEPSKFSGLMQQMGIFSPSEKLQMQQAQQMQQYQAQMQAKQIHQQGASRYGLFGGPVQQAQEANGPQIPGLAPMEDTSRQAAIMQDTMSTGGAYSSQLYKASQEFLRMGDTGRAQQAYAAALQASQEEQNERLEREKNDRERIQMRQPEGMGTVGVAGKPDFRQQQYRQLNAAGDGYDIVNQGPAYQVSSGDTNVNMGGMLNEREEADEIRKFANLLKSSSAFVSGSKHYLGDIAKGGVGGAAGSIVKGLSETFDTAKYALKAFVPDANYFDESNSRWEELSKNTGLAKATIVGMAYTLAASHSEDGRISDNDFKYALEELGGMTSDPAKARAIMLRAIGNLRQRVDTAVRYAPLSEKGMKTIGALHSKFSQEYDTAFPADLFKESPQTPPGADDGSIDGYVKDPVTGVYKKK